MNFKNVHHLREVLITDEFGKTTSSIQYSSQSISCFRPDFVEVPFKDQKFAHDLYVRFGGRVREGMKFGTEVIFDMSELRDLSGKYAVG